MLSHLVLTTFIKPEERQLGQWFQMRCMRLRVDCRFLELEEHEHLAHPTHMIPWFLMDLIADVEPNNVLYIHPWIRPTAQLVRQAMSMGAMDIGVVKREGKAKLEAMFLRNNDRSRGMLDTWIEANDQHPQASAEDNLPEVVRRHRTKAMIRDMANTLLHGITIKPRRQRRGKPIPSSPLIRFILQEITRRGKNKQWLVDRAADQAGSSSETILRMLRGETQGGVYLVDACLNALELEIVPT